MSDLQSFVNAHFGEAGSDFDAYSPPEFVPEPEGFLPLVTDPGIRSWALQVHALWPYLSRIESGSVQAAPQQHSLLTIPSPGVVAGDRFREVYYWDSFWILQGLLVSGMNTTARNVVDNLLYLVDEYGHVPNGARTYYINRSQPPLLSQMVRLVWEATGDNSLLARSLETLVREHEYWTSAPKAVPVVVNDSLTYDFSRYYANWTEPRPESYLEDVESAQGLDDEAAGKLWRNIASAAESGWDFSTRWFADGATMASIRTTDIIPSDLNAYLYQMERNLQLFSEELGDSRSSDFGAAADQRAAAMNALLFDTAEGRWTDRVVTGANADGSVQTEPSTSAFYISNYIPLWAGLLEDSPGQAQQVVQSFLQSGLLQGGGIATSLNASGQQWDAPNAWAPLQSIMVDGLTTYGGEEGQRAAAALVQAWLASNYAGFQATGKMVEKYDAESAGISGGGGEYAVQTGFGWTNGVMLDFLDRFGWNPTEASVPETAPGAA